MSAQPVHLERRSAQRFDFHLAVSVKVCETGVEGNAFTQNVSARGAFLYSEMDVAAGDAVVLELMMPSEITLAENMQVRCRGRVMRVSRIQNRSAIAVFLEGYEFLSNKDALQRGDCSRVSTLHEKTHDDGLSATTGRRMP